MQAIQISRVGKAFALSSCSDSREKKPRSRRTKEERRTMVESFIKNYRNLNNGKFPSLNLTHKEVGGSFYIVREIVREIIQHNRVLGPGNSTSKSLNLEYCLEGHVEESASLDISDHLSMSTISHAIDQNQEKYDSSSNAHRRVGEEGYSLVESVSQKTFASHPNDISLTQNVHGELDNKNSSNGPSWERDDKVQVNNSSEHPETHMVKQPFPLSQENSVDTASEINMTRKTDFPASSSYLSDTMGTERLPEANISFDSVSRSASDQLHCYSYTINDFPLPSASAKTCNPDGYHEIADINCSQKVSETSNSTNEVVSELMLFDEDSIRNKTEPKEIHSSTLIDERSDESVVNPMSKHLSSTTVSTVISTVVRLCTIICFTWMLFISFPMLLKPHELQPKDAGNVTTTSQNASGESIQHSADGPANLEVEFTHEHTFSSSGSGNNFSSGLSNNAYEDSEKSEINPLWAAFKSFITSVVKFWTE